MSLSCLKHVKRTADGERPNLPGQTDCVGVFDRSGSMYSVGNSLKESVRSWLESLQKQGRIGGKQWVVLVIFDNETNTIFEGWSTDLTDDVITHCVFQVYARGTTKLYDSAVPALLNQKQRVALREKNLSKAEKKLGVKVTRIFTIMTDGEDNMSLEFDAFKMNEEVTKHRESGAVCQFLGGNFDAETMGQNLGFTPDLSLQMDCDPSHFRAAMMAVTSSSERAACAARPTMARARSEFTGLERQTSSALPARASTEPARPPLLPSLSSSIYDMSAPLPPPSMGFLQRMSAAPVDNVNSASSPPQKLPMRRAMRRQ